MTTIDNDQVDKILEDIASIKEVINRNKPIIQQVINLSHFRLLSLLSGIGIIVFSILFNILVNIYETYNAVPTNIKYSIYFAIVIFTAILSVMKQRLYLSSLKKIDSNLTLGWLIREFFSNRFVHVYFSSIFLNIFLVFFFINKGIPYYIIPSLSIWAGLLGFTGSMFNIKNSLFMGYWFFVMGICLTLINIIPSSIAVIISFGIGCILMGILGYIDQKSGKTE